MLRTFFCFAVVASLVSAVTTRPAVAADRSIVAARDDAYIARESGRDTWAIGSSGLELIVGIDPFGALQAQQLWNPDANRTWDITGGADTSVAFNGERVQLGSTTSVAFVGATAETTADGVRLTFSFEHRARHLRISRVYACYPRTPTIETWTRFDASSATSVIQVSDMVGWSLSMPIGKIGWLGGLRGDSADKIVNPFQLESRTLEPGERIDIGSTRRSSEQFVPFALVDGDRDQFFGGVMWSGSWRMRFERGDDRMQVSASFPDISPIVPRTRPLEVPHTFFGVVPQSAFGPSGALRQFIMNGIRHGRPIRPLVTYNTWYAYGSDINEESMAEEIRFAAQLGVELAVLDAGWWSGAGAAGEYDFTSGLGSWQVDDLRFPSGLASLTSYAHAHGVKFGLWVEPTRVALTTLDQPGLAHQEWLATHQGSYESDTSAQICLVNPAGRQWVLDRLVSLIDAVQPDYLKWDNNLWLNCDRTGHGHGSSDGAFAHVQALYGLLDELRLRYPDLLIENVSGGGNRLDFGVLAYTDAAWMDDRSSPSSRVRHNLEGLSTVFPPGYLLSFVIDSEGDPLKGDDLEQLVRSRMPGVIGLTYRAGDIDADLQAKFAAEISHYKRYREIIADAHAILLSDQAPVDEQSWDALEEVTDDGRRAVLFAFEGNASNGRFIVRPRNLAPDAMYDVWSVDAGALQPIRGDLFMRNGIELAHAGGKRAHVIVLTAR